eukprot:6212612-Pleurochrysis_carterae.AAC.1
MPRSYAHACTPFASGPERRGRTDAMCALVIQTLLHYSRDAPCSPRARCLRGVSPAAATFTRPARRPLWMGRSSQRTLVQSSPSDRLHGALHGSRPFLDCTVRLLAAVAPREHHALSSILYLCMHGLVRRVKYTHSSSLQLGAAAWACEKFALLAIIQLHKQAEMKWANFDSFPTLRWIKTILRVSASMAKVAPSRQEHSASSSAAAYIHLFRPILLLRLNTQVDENHMRPFRLHIQ